MTTNLLNQRSLSAGLRVLVVIAAVLPFQSMYVQHYLLQAGEWDRVVEVGLEGIAWCELASNRQYLLFILLNTAMARARMGRWSEAEDHASHALALPRYPPSTGIAQLICAVHHAREGNRAPARLLIPELEGLFAQLFDAADPDLFWLLAKLRNALVGDAEALRVQQLIDRHGPTAC